MGNQLFFLVEPDNDMSPMFTSKAQLEEYIKDLEPSEISDYKVYMINVNEYLGIKLKVEVTLV